jgi:hypothetical protein
VTHRRGSGQQTHREASQTATRHTGGSSKLTPAIARRAAPRGDTASQPGKHSGGQPVSTAGVSQRTSNSETVSAATPTSSAKTATPEQHSDDQHDSLAQHNSNPSRATSRASKAGKHLANSVSRQRWLQHREAWNPGQQSKARIPSECDNANPESAQQLESQSGRQRREATADQRWHSKARPPRGRTTAYRTALSQRHSTPERASSGQHHSGSGGGSGPYAHHYQRTAARASTACSTPSERGGC